MSKDKGYLRALWSGNIKLQKDYLVIEKTVLAPADLIFVFGNKKIIDPLARRAAQLYHTGMAPYVLVSGGVKTESGQTEADALAAKLVALGVPQDRIVRDNLATDTLENVAFSRMTLKNTMPELDVRSVIAVGYAAAGRRFLMTLKQQWPEVLAMASHVWPEKSLSATWRFSEKTKDQIRSQFDRLERYFGLGYIAEIDPEDINARAKLLRQAAEPALRRAM